jgi:RNA-binding protein YhbY
MFRRNILAVLSLIMALMLGGGTVYAANEARPGDALYGLDRAIENLRLSLAKKDSADELRLRFAGERLTEIESLLSDDSEDSTSTPIEEIEADIFQNETVVKIGFRGGAKKVFTTDADTREEIAGEVASRFDISEAAALSLMTAEFEDRNSRPDDILVRGLRVNDSSRLKITTGLNEAVAILEEVSDEMKDAGNTELASQIALIADVLEESGDEAESGNVRIEVKEDRIRLRGQDGLDARIDIKDDGEVRIRNSNSGSGNSGREDDDRDNDDDSQDSGSIIEEIEADIFQNETVVKVEFSGGAKNTFTTQADTRDGIAEAVAARFNISKSAVLSLLTIEEEDRSSGIEDKNEDSSNDDVNDDRNGQGSDDSDKENDHENNDNDDNSGRGGGDDDDNDEDDSGSRSDDDEDSDDDDERGDDDGNDSGPGGDDD